MVDPKYITSSLFRLTALDPRGSESPLEREREICTVQLRTTTSITDNVYKIFARQGYPLVIVLRLTLIAEMDPPDIHNIMTVFFL